MNDSRNSGSDLSSIKSIQAGSSSSHSSICDFSSITHLSDIDEITLIGDINAIKMQVGIDLSDISSSSNL